MKKVRVTPWTDALILEQSYGQVMTPGLYDARRDRPVIEGLLCERIFGPMQNYKCSCGQLRSRKYAGQRCNTCKVEVTDSKVRREREGHLDLECYVLPPYSVAPTSCFLGIPIQAMESIISGKRMVALLADGEEHSWGAKAKNVKTHKSVILIDGTVARFVSAEKFKNNFESGAHHLREIATTIDSKATLEMRAFGGDLTTASYLNWKPDLEVTDLFLSKWLVLPADLRPISISDANTVESGVNVLYRSIMMKANQISVINENPDHRNAAEALFILRTLIQKGVKNLVKDGYESKHAGHIDSIGDGLKDKSGRFRENLLGKRVDYSGRSFITPNPELNIDECGIPEYMAIELLRPFIICELRKTHGMTIRGATNCWKDRRPAAYEALHKLVADKIDPPLVMLNRAPSLHRYSVQGLVMKLHTGKSIMIAPEICAPKNADFDGDTEAVHVVLTKKGRQELRALVMPEANLIGYARAQPTYNMSHEMIVGVYFLTYDAPEAKGMKPRAAATRKQAINDWDMSFESGYKEPIQRPVMLRTLTGWIETTVGRCIVEEAIQTAPGYITGGLDKGGITKMLKDCIQENIRSPRVVLERTKALRTLGFKWSTQMGLSIAPEDCKAPEGMKEIMAEAGEFEKNSRNEEEATRNWAKVTHELEKEWIEQTGDDNNLKFMYMTKSRVSPIQLRQMCIMKGQIAGAAGDIVLVKHSLADGLTPWEYLLTCKGARSSFGANNEVVPQSGYFCRQAVHALRELHVGRDGDSWGSEGIMLKGKDAVGRYDMEGDMITMSDVLEMGSDHMFEVQSVVHGIGPISTKELGIDPTTMNTFLIGVPIGIITAQSAAESTTQLGLRQKHLSGAIVIAESSEKRVDVKKSGMVENIVESERMIRVTIAGLTYTYHKDFVTLINEPVLGKLMNEGDIICVYSDSLTGADISGLLAQLIKFLGANNPGKSFTFPRAMLAPKSGVVKHVVRKVADPYDYYESSREECVVGGQHIKAAHVKVTGDYVCEYVDILVDGQLVGTLKEKNAMLVPDGAYVNLGDFLTFGLPDVETYFGQTQSLQATWDMYYKHMQVLFGGFERIHYEMLFRAMTEVCNNSAGTKVLRASLKEGDTFSPMVMGINKVPHEYPSLLKKLSFSHIDRNLSKSLKVLCDSTPMPSENVLMGGLVPSPWKPKMDQVEVELEVEVSEEDAE